MNSRAPSRRGAVPQPRRGSGTAARSKSGLLRRIGRTALYGVLGFLIASIVLVALYRALPPPATPLMLFRRVEGYGIDKSWRRLDEIAPHLIRAAMAGEDARFCRHHGFDWGAIATAWDLYQNGHRRLRGASTISMQTAKNVFLWPGRDWLRKGFEAWFTPLIELAWGSGGSWKSISTWSNGGRASTARRPPRDFISTSRRTRLTRRRLSVSRRRSPIRSTGHRAAPAGACSPAALGSARTCQASPRRCPCPAGEARKAASR